MDKKFECELKKGSFFRGYCWQKSYLRISILNIFVILSLFTLGSLGVFAYILGFDKKEIILAMAICFFLYGSILFSFGKYFFVHLNWIKGRNVYIVDSVIKSSMKYEKWLILKYIAIIVYQSLIFFPFAFSIIGSSLGLLPIESSPVLWFTIPFYFSWFFLILIDYKNSIVEIDDKKVKFKIYKKIIGFIMYAFFWSFMINYQDYKIPLENFKNK